MAIAQRQATPSWQNNLNSYSSNANAGNAEVARAQQVYASKMASGDTAGANAAHSWANQIRDAMGVSNQYNRSTGAAVPQTQTQQVTAQQTQLQQPDYLQQAQTQVASVYDPLRESQLAQVRVSKEKALGQLNLQRQDVAPQYNDLKNQTDATNAQNVQKLREMMAANGLGQSGDNVSGQVALNAQRGTDLNALNLQQQQRLNGIDQSITDVNNANDEATINAQLNSEQAKAALDLQQTLASQAAQKQQMDSQATGLYNPWSGYTLNSDIQKQLAPYSGNYQAFIDANPNSPLVPYAQNARFQKVMSGQASQDKYGSQYQTVAAKTSNLQNVGLALDNIASSIKNSYLPASLKADAALQMQKVKSGTLDYPTALANLNQIYAQTNATNAGVVTNAFNAQTDATYKQGLLAKTTTSDKALAAGKLKAMNYFDTFKNPASATPWNDQQPTIDQRNNLKQFYGTELNKILTNPNPAQAIQDPVYRQSIIDTYKSWTGNHILTALENTLQNYTPGE